MSKILGNAILKQIQMVSFNFFIIIRHIITTKILNGFRRKEKTAAIFFYIKKVYDKVNREKTLEQLENMGIQGKVMEFITEVIKVRMKGYISQSKQTN